jgi:DNA-binding response OmpR family regulator
MKILVIEDEEGLGQAIIKYLESENYITEWAKDKKNAIDKLEVYAYDCVLIDLMLPDGSGLDIISHIKSLKLESGLIIISAKNSLDDKLMGLELGADDYLTKPFHLPELNARLKALMRRRKFDGDLEINLGDIIIKPEAMQVLVHNSELILTKKEFDLLMYFVMNKNRIMTKSTIAEHLYGDDIDQADSFNFLYSHIKNLRKKILDLGGNDYLQTVYGVGYKFNVA